MNPGTSDLLQALRSFSSWRAAHLTGDEKGEAQTFLERMFQAFGHPGLREAGATLEYRLKKDSGKGTAFADLMWKPRVLVEMKKSGTDLSKHYRQAFDYWIRAVPDRPRYVMLCNFDEFWVYDFDSQLDEPVDKIAITDLSHRWEAMTFMLPDPVQPAFGNDLVEVTREAASSLADVFTRMHTRGVGRLDAQRFTLQSVMAMFAEDIGLLPTHMFTKALDDCLKADNPSELAYELLFGLFREMNAPGTTSGGRYRGTPYFNGGLFAEIKAFELTLEELQGLRHAALTNWSFVRPEIFGTLFEQSMSRGQRHAHGAHFTSQADIARIVIPTIVTPWRERIAGARARGSGGVAALRRLLEELSTVQVLDPACGSGNFLYVAYREMRRLEHEIHDAIAEVAPKSVDAAQTAIAYVSTRQFHGLDINEFAVEVAKITMMLGKKLATDELGDYDSVLPLENLGDTILARDALFTPWPRADVIIGNPPYLGRRKMVEELGVSYTRQLAAAFPQVAGVSDFVCYWFPRVHDHLAPGSRAGLVATNTIRQNDSRISSLDYVVDYGGVIFDAVSTQPWSGDAAVHVSIVNWIKDGAGVTLPNPRVLWLNDAELRLEIPMIPPSLSPSVDVRRAHQLSVNRIPKVCFQGQTPGVTDGFTIDASETELLDRLRSDSAEVLYPFLGGDDLLKKLSPPRYVLDIATDDLVLAEMNYPSAIAHLRRNVLPVKEGNASAETRRNADALVQDPNTKLNRHHANFLSTWWQMAYRRADMLEAIARLDRYIGLTILANEKRPSVFAFIDASVRPTALLQVFAFDDDYSLGVLHSSLHRLWFEARCSTMETRLRYTPTTVFDSFPWPQAPRDIDVRRIAGLVNELLDLRARYLDKGVNLASMYNTLRSPGRSKLRSLHEGIDSAVMTAYGFSATEDPLAQLLALNQSIAADPQVARGPGGEGLRGTKVSNFRITG